VVAKGTPRVEYALRFKCSCCVRCSRRRGKACLFATPGELVAEHVSHSGRVGRGRNEEKTGGPGVSRTRDPSFRKRMLYPSELRGHVLNSTVWLRKCTPRFVLRGGQPSSAIRQPISTFRLRELPRIPPGRPSVSCRQPKVDGRQFSSLLAVQALT
jgi:hypothetical protein